MLEKMLKDRGINTADWKLLKWCAITAVLWVQSLVAAGIFGLTLGIYVICRHLF